MDFKLRSQLIVEVTGANGKVIGDAYVYWPAPRRFADVQVEGRRTCYLHRLWVSRKHRGNGIALQLMHEVLRRVGPRELIILRVAPFDAFGMSRRKLRAFYRSFGFVPLAGYKDKSAMICLPRS